MVVAPESEPQIDQGHEVVRDFLRAARKVAQRDPHATLQMLEDTLPIHFAWEEQKEGFLETLSAIRIATVLAEKFRAEHTEFRLALEELRAAADRGDSAVAVDVQRLVDRVRAHERLEAAAAARLGGTPAPGVVRMPSPPGNEVSPVVAAVVTRLANEIEERVRAHNGVLSGVTIGIPANVPVDTYIDALENELAARRIDFVDFVCEECSGPARVVSLRFEPGWAS